MPQSGTVSSPPGARRHRDPVTRRPGVLGTALTTAGVILLAACGSGSGSRSRSGADSRPGSELLGQGDVVADDGSGFRPPVAAASGGRWSVLLGTFTGEDHLARAEAFREDVATRFPVFDEAFVQPRRAGSMVVVGRFESPEDESAQELLGLAKAITGSGGSRPFATAMLVRRTMAMDSGPPKPFDLRVLRQRYPNQRQLYTLQVAVWSTLGTREITPEEVRRSAERYATELRTRGYEAWFHHDPDTETSTVTIGGFGADAYDPRSTLYAPEVERLMKAFPAQRLNGEEVLVAVDPRNAAGETRPKPCVLVEVPLD